MATVGNDFLHSFFFIFVNITGSFGLLDELMLPVFTGADKPKTVMQWEMDESYLN